MIIFRITISIYADIMANITASGYVFINRNGIVRYSNYLGSIYLSRAATGLYFCNVLQLARYYISQSSRCLIDKFT